MISASQLARYCMAPCSVSRTHSDGGQRTDLEVAYGASQVARPDDVEAAAAHLLADLLLGLGSHWRAGRFRPNEQAEVPVGDRGAQRFRHAFGELARIVVPPLLLVRGEIAHPRGQLRGIARKHVVVVDQVRELVEGLPLQGRVDRNARRWRGRLIGAWRRRRRNGASQREQGSDHGQFGSHGATHTPRRGTWLGRGEHLERG